jgi:hypothetical protein
MIAAAGGMIRDKIRRGDGCQSVAVLCAFESLDGFFEKNILVLRYFRVDDPVCLLHRTALAYPAETCVPGHSNQYDGTYRSPRQNRINKHRRAKVVVSGDQIAKKEVGVEKAKNWVVDRQVEGDNPPGHFVTNSDIGPFLDVDLTQAIITVRLFPHLLLV